MTVSQRRWRDRISLCQTCRIWASQAPYTQREGGMDLRLMEGQFTNFDSLFKTSPCIFPDIKPEEQLTWQICRRGGHWKSGTGVRILRAAEKGYDFMANLYQYILATQISNTWSGRIIQYLWPIQNSEATPPNSTETFSNTRNSESAIPSKLPKSTNVHL